MEERDKSSDQPKAPNWAGRVHKWKLARLYESHAKGIVDEDLINDVAYTLLLRCESMLMVEEAHRGRATCPVCSGTVERNMDKQPQLVCNCGWRGYWHDYWMTYKGKHLTAGGLESFCKEIIQRFPSAKNPSEKMLLIDWLVHRFHWEGVGESPGRPGAVCLIGSKSAEEANEFLYALTMGDKTHSHIRQEHSAWRTIRDQQRSKGRARQEAHAQGVAAKRQRQAEKKRRRAEKIKSAHEKDN